MKPSFRKSLCRAGITLIAVFACSGCDSSSDKNNESWPPADKLTGNETTPDIDWVTIEAGSFTFGSPEDTPCRAPTAEKQVSVTLTRSFLIAATEVTQAQWESLDLPNPSQNKGADKPVTFIDFYESLVWCNKLSQLEGLDTCYDLSSCTNPVGTGCGPDEQFADEGCWNPENNFNCTGEIHKYADWYACPGYRLPTTAEWEYAAKAGVTDTHTYGGDLLPESIGDCGEQPSLDDIAWYCHNSGNEIHKVGQKAPNSWGLYDTLGNVYEWVDYFVGGQPLDYDSPDKALTDPIGPRDGDMKNLRGRTFHETGCYTTPNWQFSFYPFGRRYDSGFRPVRTIFE